MEMTCPKCHGQMRQYERSGVTVDQCGECRGIFLDRGELERLIDAENSWHGTQQPPAPGRYRQSQPYHDYDSDEYPVYGGSSGHHGKRKRRGFLEELFD
jgi:Zn-finger nucleic acid-binding protein